ncbi:MAG: toll/interleukin-1 receptor domain-containing protein [Anaerolineae bacterium]|jgi:hypothetical protein
MTDHKPNHVFLSYSAENEAFVESLARRLLEEAHLSFWFRPLHAIPGGEIQQQMEEALWQAQSCAVFISSGEIKGWQNEQMRAAIQARVEDEPGYRVIPVLVPGTTPPEKRNLPRFLRLYEPVEFNSPDDERAFKYLLSGILGIPPIEVEGFLETKTGKAPPAGQIDHKFVRQADKRSGAGKWQVDGANPPIRTIRKLLLAAFDANALYQFCQDRAAFRGVLVRFGSGRVLDAMVDEVIAYCGRFLLWDRLLAEVAGENPAQYARFEAALRDEGREA